MAFLDNSGDIILDAVLTDTGRYRLAKGDGSFRISKFALSDDEINYKLYNKNNPSGSAYYDLEILQTPILEAFTNNTSTMNYKLLSIPRTNLLYLPIVKINSNFVETSVVANGIGGFALAVTDETWNTKETTHPGVMSGDTKTLGSNYIRTDQGIDNGAISFVNPIDTDLLETQYIVEIDSRMGVVCGFNLTKPDANPSFIDDDNIASYYLSDDTNYVERITEGSSDVRGWPTNATTFASTELTIAGPQGTTLRFAIRSTLETISSDFLFDTLGNTWESSAEAALWGFSSSHDYKYMDTVIKITGATTGYKINIPVRLVKLTS